MPGQERQVKAWVVERANGPFIEREIPVPALKDNEVRVRVHASGINPLDLKIRSGAAGHAQQPLPAVLGLDMAGEVEGVGSLVEGFSAGDQVYGMVGGVGGIQGTLAEYVSVPGERLAHKPATLSMREAACLPLVTITAWEGIVDRAKVQAGNTVLVQAGAGGVGYITVQLAVAHGARVYATVSPDKSFVVKDCGAIPLDYTSMTMDQMVAEATGGEGFDIIYDTLGGKTLDDSFPGVKRYTGHVVSCLGWGTHALAPLSFRGATYSGVFTLMPLLAESATDHHGAILNAATKLIEAGHLKPLLSADRFGVTEIDQAYEAVSKGTLGKVVIELDRS